MYLYTYTLNIISINMKVKFDKNHSKEFIIELENPLIQYFKKIINPDMEI